MTVPMWVWGATVLAVLLLIAFDFFTVSRTPHEVGIGEAARWSIFSTLPWQWHSGSASTTSWVRSPERSSSLRTSSRRASVDNLFVFAIILAQFAVPSILQQRVLLIGIVLALIFRAVFIAIGAAALSAFAFTFVIFGPCSYGRVYNSLDTTTRIRSPRTTSW